MRAIVARRLRKQAYTLYITGSAVSDYLEVSSSGFRKARFGGRVYQFFNSFRRKVTDVIPRNQGQIICDPDSVRTIYKRLKKAYIRRQSFEGVLN